MSYLCAEINYGTPQSLIKNLMHLIRRGRYVFDLKYHAVIIKQIVNKFWIVMVPQEHPSCFFFVRFFFRFLCKLNCGINSILKLCVQFVLGRYFANMYWNRPRIWFAKSTKFYFVCRIIHKHSWLACVYKVCFFAYWLRCILKQLRLCPYQLNY